MRARNAELSRPQFLTSFQSSAGERHKGDLEPVQAGVAVRSVTLYRLASAAGVGSALILLVNAAKRSALIPTTDLTQLLAPVAEIMALGLVTGLFLAFGRRAGLFGTVAFAINFIATGEFGWRGSGDQPRILEPSGDNYHRAESRVARAFS